MMMPDAPLRLALFSLAFGMIAGWPAVSGAKRIVGPAYVIEGDTIDVSGQRIRFHGVDTPEGKQPCLDSDGTRFRCGFFARAALERLLGTKLSPVTQGTLTAMAGLLPHVSWMTGTSQT